MSWTPASAAKYPIIDAVLSEAQWAQLSPQQAATRLRRLSHDSPVLGRVIPQQTITALLLDYSDSARELTPLPEPGLLQFPAQVVEHLAAETGSPLPGYAELPMGSWESHVRFHRIHDINAYFVDADDLHDPEVLHIAITSEHPDCCEELSQILGQAEEAAALFADEEAAEANLGQWLTFGGRHVRDSYWHTWLRMIVQKGEAHLREFHTVQTETSIPGQPVETIPDDTLGPTSDHGAGPVASLIDLLGDFDEGEVEDCVMRFRRTWGRRTLWDVLPRSTATRLIRQAAESSPSMLPGNSVDLTPGQRDLLVTVADLIDMDLYDPAWDELPMNGWEARERFPSLCRLADLSRTASLSDALTDCHHGRRSLLAALLGEATEALALFPSHREAETNLAHSLGAGVRDWLVRVRSLGREAVA